MVEVAGVEPACEHRKILTSTCVVDLKIFFVHQTAGQQTFDRLAIEKSYPAPQLPRLRARTLNDARFAYAHRLADMALVLIKRPKQTLRSHLIFLIDDLRGQQSSSARRQYRTMPVESGTPPISIHVQTPNIIHFLPIARKEISLMIFQGKILSYLNFKYILSTKSFFKYGVVL